MNSRALLLVGLLFAVTPVACLHGQCVSPPAGLVSWWRAEGNNLDYTSTNNAVANGGLTFATGKAGQGFSLENNAFLSVPASRDLDVGLGSGFTFEAWMKPDDVTSGHAIFEYNDGNGNMGVQLWHSISAYGGLGSLFANIIDTGGDSHYIASAPGLLTTEFQHVALAYDKATGTATL